MEIANAKLIREKNILAEYSVLTNVYVHKCGVVRSHIGEYYYMCTPYKRIKPMRIYLSNGSKVDLCCRY